MDRPPLPPFTLETATQKVRMAEDAGNGLLPVRLTPCDIKSTLGARPSCRKYF